MSTENSESLMRYLNGEISVFEWLEVGKNEKSSNSKAESSSTEKCTTDLLEDLLKDDDDNEDDIEDDDDDIEEDDVEEDSNANEDAQRTSECGENKKKGSLQTTNIAEDETTNQQTNLDTDTPLQAPTRMTELLLDLPGAKQVKKHGGKTVDEFRTDIPLTRKQAGTRRKNNTVPNKLKKRMGEANILCAKGQYDSAKSICMDIIKQVPKCPEPFQTLGMLCEMQGQMDKALQFFLISAYLSKSSDVEEWLKLAVMSLEMNQYKQALTCYNQALKYDPENVSILWDRAALHYQMKDMKKAIEGYETLLKLIPIDSPEKFFDLSIEMAMIHHEDSCLEKAIEIMNLAFEKYPDRVDYKAINLLAELNMTVKQYSVALKNICILCKFTQKSSNEEDTRAEEPLSSFSNLLGYDIQKPPQQSKAPAIESSIPNLSSKAQWIIPDTVPIDIRVKAAVCLIYIQHLDPVKTLMSPLLKENIEEVGDLFLDIAEAYADTGEHEEALPILDLLVSSPKYDQAAVWLKKAQCLMSLGRLQDAILSYNKVVTLAPNHLEARITLSSLHQQLGQPEQALDVLSEKSNDTSMFTPLTSETSTTNVSVEPMEIDKTKEEFQPQDYRLMFHKCVLLESQNRTEDFVESGIQLFSKYFRDVYFNAPDESEKYLRLKLRKRSAVKAFKKRSKRMAARLSKQQQEEQNSQDRGAANLTKSPGSLKAGSAGDTGIRVDEWFDLLKKVIIQASSISRHHDAEHLILCGLNSARLQHNKDYQQDLEFMSVIVHYLNKKHKLAFDYVRHFMIPNIDNQMLWNILSAIVCKTEDLRHHRYCLRLVQKYPDNVNLLLFNGHNAFMAGSYKFAIGEYMHAFRQDPQDPMISLCLALQYLHLACQKFPRGRNMMVVQGIIFLFQYLALRGECQEVYYNIGRAFHQLGLLHFAVHYYQKALDCPFHSSSTDVNGNPKVSEIHDLHRESAFNLALIYKTSGNYPMARQILYKYITL